MKEKGKEQVVLAINKLNKLDFIKTAMPEYIYGTEKEDEVTNGIPFEEGFLGGEFVGLNGDELMQAVVRSRQELITFFEQRDIVWTDNTPIWQRYNDEFFETKAILLYFTITSSVSISHILADVRITTGSLELHIVGQYFGDTMLDMEGFASFVIEVNRSDINDIATFEVNVEYEKLGD